MGLLMLDKQSIWDTVTIFTTVRKNISVYKAKLSNGMHRTLLRFVWLPLVSEEKARKDSVKIWFYFPMALKTQWVPPPLLTKTFKPLPIFYDWHKSWFYACNNRSRAWINNECLWQLLFWKNSMTFTLPMTSQQVQRIAPIKRTSSILPRED